MQPDRKPVKPTFENIALYSHVMFERDHWDMERLAVGEKGGGEGGKKEERIKAREYEKELFTKLGLCYANIRRLDKSEMLT